MISGLLKGWGAPTFLVQLGRPLIPGPMPPTAAACPVRLVAAAERARQQPLRLDPRLPLLLGRRRQPLLRRHR